MLASISDPVVFEAHHAVPRASIEDGDVKLVKNGYGEIHAVESCFLEPAVHSLMDIDEYEISLQHCKQLVLTVSLPAPELTGRLVSAYIRRGEELGVHKGSTVEARTHASRAWCDLTNARHSPLLWAKSHQYRHCAPMNPNQFAANCNLYTVDVDEPELAGAVLNSTLVVLAKHLYERPVGVESNLKTEVVDVNMMPVPDWIGAEPAVRTAHRRVQGRSPPQGACISFRRSAFAKPLCFSVAR